MTIKVPNLTLVCETIKDTCNSIVRHCPNNGVIVELGTYLGRSAAYIIDALLQHNKTFSYYAIDNFKYANIAPVELQHRDGVLNFPSHREAFEANLQDMGIYDYVQIIESDTLAAHALFDNNSVYCLFIDDEHNGEWVKKELHAWLPKVRYPEGIIIGDDFYDIDIRNAFISVLGKYVHPSNPNTYAMNGCIIFMREIYDDRESGLSWFR